MVYGWFSHKLNLEWFAQFIIIHINQLQTCITPNITPIKRRMIQLQLIRTITHIHLKTLRREMSKAKFALNVNFNMKSFARVIILHVYMGNIVESIIVTMMFVWYENLLTKTEILQIVGKHTNYCS